MPIGRDSGCGRERRSIRSGGLICLVRGERSYSVTGGWARKYETEFTNWDVNELVIITEYVRVLGTHSMWLVEKGMDTD